MKEARIRFQKKAEGKYISHLDLNRMFARALCRLSVPVRYTEGFNPHPYLVFGPPLPVGTTGDREVLDIAFTGEEDEKRIKEGLNGTLSSMGVVITEVYEPEEKLSRIAYARYEAEIYWEEKTPPAFLEQVKEYFASKTAKVLKRTKGGEKEICLTDFIEEIDFSQRDEKSLFFEATVVCSGQENLNPAYIARAVAERFGLTILYATYARNGFYTAQKKAFI